MLFVEKKKDYEKNENNEINEVFRLFRYFRFFRNPSSYCIQPLTLIYCHSAYNTAI